MVPDPNIAVWIFAAIGAVASVAMLAVFLYALVTPDPGTAAARGRMKSGVLETDAEYEETLRRLHEIEGDADRRLRELRRGGR